MLVDKQAQASSIDAPGDGLPRPIASFGKLLRLAGLLVMIALSLGWLLTFPTLDLIRWGFTGDRSVFLLDRPLNPVAAFFNDWPQILWLGFALGAILFFIGSPTPSATPESKPALVELEVAGLRRTLPGWLNRVWRYGGVVALLGILVLATYLRVVAARSVGDTDMIRSDYDEGVHASAALLMAQGKTVYRDFFLTQPPVGLWLWSLPLRFGGAEWGSLNDFLRLRLFSSLFGIATVVLVYVTGRKLGGRWAGPIAGSIAALALALDGAAIRADQQIMLEPIINFFTAAALCAFVHHAPGRRLSWIGMPLLAGLLVGLAFAIKAPSLVVIVGLGLTLLAWRRWLPLLVFGAGAVGAFLLTCGYSLLTVGVDFIKQAYLYRSVHPFSKVSLFGPFESDTSLTAFSYMARSPYLSFTLLAAVLGIGAIVLRWATGRGGAMWLPVVLVTVLTAWSYTAKAGFFPHYYAQMALPLALVAGGIVNFWQPQWWRGRLGAGLSLTGALAVVVLLWPTVRYAASEEPSKPDWSPERAVGRSFENLGLSDGKPVMSWDARYNFIMGRPLALDSYNKYLADTSAYTDYLSLGLDEMSLFEAIGKTTFGKKYNGSEMRDFRYTPVVQENWIKTARTADYTLIEARAGSVLTPETRQSIRQILANRFENEEVSIFSSVGAIRYPSLALFGDRIRLMGFNTAPEIKAGTSKLPLTLFWKGEQKIEQNHTIFIHLLNEKGETVAQRDTAPRYGALNTTKWTPGATIDDDHSLELATNLPPGRYKLEIGVYRTDNGQRLALTEAPEEQPVSSEGDSIIVFEVKILAV